MSYRPSDLLRGPAIPDTVLQALPKTDLHASLIIDPPRTAEHLEQAARKLAEDAASSNVRVLEARLCPPLHTGDGLTNDGAVAAVRAGLETVARKKGLEAGIVVMGRRDFEPERNLELARLAVAWHVRGVVAFGLGGPEDGHPTADHREAFYHAKNNNLPSTCDAESPVAIQEAIHRFGAIRVGQAVRLHEDPALLDFCNDHRIALEICLSSNVRTGAVATVGDHPLRSYHDAGLRLCLNTDGNLESGSDMVSELRLAVDTFDFTLLELENFLLAGFKSAFLPERKARMLIEGALTDFKRIRDEHHLDDLVARGGPA